MAIRNESSEAILVLLYDRIDGGVTRFDLYIMLLALEKCNDYEFGVTAQEYVNRGSVLQGGIQGGKGSGWLEHSQLLHGAGGGGGVPSSVSIMEQMKCRLNSIWGLIFAECMGLWRASSSSPSANNNTTDASWIENHPLFSGLNDSNNKQAQVELEALCHRLHQGSNA